MAILDKIISAAFRFFSKKRPPKHKSKRGKRKHSIRKKAVSKRPPKIAKRVKAKKRVVSKKKKVKKSPVKKVLKRVSLPAKPALSEERIGAITHYFSRIQVVVVKLTKDLKVGEKIRIKGRSTNFVQRVRSLQIESVDVKAAKKGDLVGLKVDKIAKEGDMVFRAK